MLIWMLIHFVGAQTVSVTSQYRLDLKGKQGHHPVLSESGDKLLFSDAAYQALHLYEFESEKVQTLSRAQNSGFDPIFSNDNSTVFFRTTTYSGGYRYDALESYRLNDNKQVRMIEPQRNMRTARSYHNGALVKADGQLLKTTFGRTKAVVPAYVSSEDLKIFVYNSGARYEIQPMKGENINYIWVSLSPDETKILFTAVGKGTFVSDLRGNILAELGYLNAPVWYNNNFVVGMQDLDDGHYITDSKVLIQSLDGKVKKQLSREGEISLYPTASSAAGRVIYATGEGALLVTEIEIK